MTTESEDWSMPEEMRPQRSEVRFDLDRALQAMVSLRAEVPEDAFTAQTLGTDRSGNGVVIDDDGTVLTIGYLITEAQTVWLRNHAGQVVQGYPLAYDQVTGFGLVKALGSLRVPALSRGSAARCARGDTVYVAGHGGLRHALKARLIDKREFAGYWEYLLDEALFTAPAFPQWSGAALIGEDGQLLGIGSLLVQEGVDGRTVQANMMVPVDLLEPILPQMMATGRAGGPPRPWLGVYAAQSESRVVVAGVADSGPAQKAGLRQSDLVLDVAGQPVATLAGFLRAVWSTGEAGTAVPLKIARGGDVLRIVVESVDRNDLLRRTRLH
jgi:S1-C subfamily serine protease